MVAHCDFGGVQPLMDVYHERMEVHSALALDGRGKGLIKEVHKHCFTRADIAIKVEAFRSCFRRRCGRRYIAAEYPRKLQMEVSTVPRTDSIEKLPGYYY